MRSKTGGVTSFDVARAAGVSQPTVSRAMRHLPSISPTTRERVLAAARELNYVPSDSGRALSTQSSRRVAVVSEELTNPYYPELIEPLRAELDRHGYRAVLVIDADASKVSLEALTDGSYDGVVLSTTRRSDTLPRDLSARGMPHVMVNRVLDHPESASCAIDNVTGAQAVADLILSLGHRHIASLQGPLDTSTGRERARAFAAAIRRSGRSLERDLNRRAPFDHDAALAAARRLLARTPRPTAIACGNDVIAFGVLSAAREMGLDVPGDLTIVGFDDIRMAGWPSFGMTTVHCDLPQLAATAVELLVGEMKLSDTARDEASMPPCIRVKPHLVLRSTHAPPRALTAGSRAERSS